MQGKHMLSRTLDSLKKKRAIHSCPIQSPIQYTPTPLVVFMYSGLICAPSADDSKFPVTISEFLHKSTWIYLKFMSKQTRAKNLLEPHSGPRYLGGCFYLDWRQHIYRWVVYLHDKPLALCNKVWSVSAHLMSSVSSTLMHSTLDACQMKKNVATAHKRHEIHPPTPPIWMNKGGSMQTAFMLRVSHWVIIWKRTWH